MEGRWREAEQRASAHQERMSDAEAKLSVQSMQIRRLEVQLSGFVSSDDAGSLLAAELLRESRVILNESCAC
jgi:hypothetical protein